tara:strand:+ start:5857 stop:6183 length:327 start_codon:yes stop_codon:yes gene_type:complete
MGCSDAEIIDSPNAVIDWGSTPSNITRSVKAHFASSVSKKHASVRIKKTTKSDIDYYELRISCSSKKHSNQTIVYSEKPNVELGNNQINSSAAKFLARQIIIYTNSIC